MINLTLENQEQANRINAVQEQLSSLQSPTTDIHTQTEPIQQQQ